MHAALLGLGLGHRVSVGLGTRLLLALSPLQLQLAQLQAPASLVPRLTRLASSALVQCMPAGCSSLYVLGTRILHVLRHLNSRETMATKQLQLAIS